ncbi:DUF11 domain-containing protein [Chitinophaga agrisoli]|uniref:DUF11 domain-containing protein n=1 Tax=Chitinophaga agrisoli TaxID=2607653 RepID=A0A5B2VQD1_9BACT|nr:right-handed parallel beta-helix repeat-containing protein [Chitinophaga agrisoli]KAA2241371.1 DUF11 domain-containing protein [Chitinophaga agrisoli]
MKHAIRAVVHSQNNFLKLLLLLLLLMLIPYAAARAQTGVSFTVNTLGDEEDPDAGEIGDDGHCDVDPNTPGDQCTFRAAIQNHNGNRNLDHNFIFFEIPNAPEAPGTGNNIITIGATGLGALPSVLGSVTIDGINHASPNSSRIEIDGSMAGATAIGLQLLGGKDEITFLVITKFSSHGVFIAGTPPPGEGGHLLQSLYIGTDQAGANDKGNGGDGIFIDNTPGNTIGGVGVLGNVIAANKGYGIRILGRDQSETGQPNGAHDNRIFGNKIGQDFTGNTELANEQGGILNQNAPVNTIGGATPGQGNTVMGTKTGIWVEGSLSKGVLVLGNFVGKDGTVAKFTAGIRTRAGEQLSVQGNILTNIDSVGIDIFLDANGNYNILKNKITGKAKVGAKFTFGPGRVIQVNYSNNLSFGNDVGLDINESLNGTINWQLVGDTAMNGQTGANLVFRAAGTKQLSNNHWEANASIGFKYLCDFAQGVTAAITINGDVYAKNGAEGFSGKVQLQTQATLTFRLLKLSGSENGKDGMTLGLAATGGARGDVLLGGGTDLSFNLGAALRLQGEKSSIDLFKVSIEDLDAHGNKDRDVVFYLFDIKLGNSFVRNTITDNVGTAIVLDGSSEARIDSNTITNNGGAIQLRDLATATMGRNTISGNAKGIMLAGTGTGSPISANSIFSNTGLGIDLGNDGVTPNDAGDADTGPNNLQNFPVLTAVNTSGGNTTIQGTLNSMPNTAYKLEFFSNAACNPAGFGEGQTFLGSETVTTNASGDAPFSVVLTGVALSPGAVVTATATDPANNTSEFSACLSGGNVQLADLELTKAANNTTLNLGAPVSFTLQLVNKGPSNASGVVVRDLLPAGISFTQASPSTGTYNNATGQWLVGTVNNGAQAALTITGTVTQIGTITNTAEVTASGLPDPDSKPDNGIITEDDQDSATVTVQQQNSIEAQIVQLGVQVNALVASGDLTRQQGDILNALLGAALRFYRDGNPRAAIGTLQVFIGVVNVFTRIRNFPNFHRLSRAKGRELTRSAEKIIAAIRAAIPPASPVMDNGRKPELVLEGTGNGVRQFGNYPNPFRQYTNIIFELPEDTKVRLTVFDQHGRIVTQLLNTRLTAGRHLVPWRPGHLPAGMYLLRLDTDDGGQTIKMIYTE